MTLTPIEYGLVFVMLTIMALSTVWLLRRGAKRNYLADRAELRMAAGELASLVSREFELAPCAECKGVNLELTSVGDSGGTAEFRCTECGTGGSASVSGDASEKAVKNWERYSALREAFEAGQKAVDPEDVAVRFRVWVANSQ